MHDAAIWDGQTAHSLAAMLDLPRVELRTSVPSTMDVAHALASEGTPAGTLVLADEQTAGRGRGGKRWRSDHGAGIWMTIIERPNDAEALGVLAIRLGLRAAPVLDRHVDAPIRLKWPNDVLVNDRKLAGILVEARWRDGSLDWVAIGLGVNVRVDANDSEGAAMRAGTRRPDVLAELVPVVRAAARARGRLTEDELERWRARDLAAGRRCRQPIAGRIRGVAPDGALIVEQGGTTALAHSGSLVLEDDS